MGDKPWWKFIARGTGAATGGDGSNVNTGVQIFMGHPAATQVARSLYRHQVEQIFPWELTGREAELAELAEFCARADGDSYMWWQGPPWAGKSALMATLVLHPPTGVRMVSFFITARYPGQSDRSAFLEVVLKQLAEVAGQPMPDALTESERQGWINQLLHDAAAACERDGTRLVLAVDGLDEDRGVATGPGAHSIAALLPAVPPPGMRVVVAGRPDPPVPPDVPARHPLRDPEIVRRLSSSPHAQMIRDDAERELGFILDGDELERDLLGLVTAAGGGLTSGDLAELTGRSPGKVERILRAVTGRTFQSRDSRWRTSGTRVFMLAHEELQRIATADLGSDMLAGLRDRLHEWTGRYRDQGWPVGTPEYLLRDYHRLLHAIGDLERMTALTTDQARLNRMLDISGGDAAALAEITAAQQLVCGQESPDLTAMLALAIARNRLTLRNSKVPAGLPAIWIALGNPSRAEALARSITDPSAQAQALSAVAGAMAEAGDCRRAEEIAASITDRSELVNALAAVAGGWVKAGDLGRAESIVDAVPDQSDRTGLLMAMSRALVETGDFDRAEEVARRVPDRSDREWVLVFVTGLVAEAGDLAWAERAAGSITDPSARSRALLVVSGGLVKAGALGRAETIARSVSDPYEQAGALVVVATALAETGHIDRAHQTVDRAEEATHGAADSPEQAPTLAAVAGALAKAGDIGRAEEVARSITEQDMVAWALAAVARALVEAGDLEGAYRFAGAAEEVARAIGNPPEQAWALAAVAEALVEAGDLDWVRRLIDRAEELASSAVHPSDRTQALTAVVEALTKMGALDRAAALTCAVPHPQQQARSLATVAEEPSNIILSADGPRVLDYDIARVMDDVSHPVSHSPVLSAVLPPAWARNRSRDRRSRRASTSLQGL